MSQNSEPHSLARQRGMTLAEMLLAVALMGLMSTLMMSGSGALRQSQESAHTAKRDFTLWYTGLQTRALYQSQPYRVCLTRQRAELETYSRETGWQKNGVFFLPRPSIRIIVSGEACSGVLNTGDALFLSQVHFDDAA